MEIRKLNTLRGLAALIVLVSHYSNASGIWGGSFGHGAGQFGVMIFFLLSSFLMAHLYLETPPTAGAMKNYAVARFARVIPLFVVVVIASFAAYKINIFSEFAYNIDSTESLMSHLLLLQGDNVLWTIQPEIHFYILFACVWFLRPRFLKSIVFLLALTLVAYALGAWPDEPTATVFGLDAIFNITIALPYFIVGLLLGLAFHHWQPPPWLCSHWFVAALLLIPFLFPDIFYRVTGGSHGMWSAPGVLACVSIIFFAVVFLVPLQNPFLENKIGDKIGEISYSLYLLHYPLLMAMKKIGLVTGIPGLFLFLTVSLTLAFTSFTLLESPMRRKIRALCSSKDSFKPAPQSGLA